MAYSAPSSGRPKVSASQAVRSHILPGTASRDATSAFPGCPMVSVRLTPQALALLKNGSPSTQVTVQFGSTNCLTIDGTKFEFHRISTETQINQVYRRAQSPDASPSATSTFALAGQVTHKMALQMRLDNDYKERLKQKSMVAGRERLARSSVRLDNETARGLDQSAYPVSRSTVTSKRANGRTLRPPVSTIAPSHLSHNHGSGLGSPNSALIPRSSTIGSALSPSSGGGVPLHTRLVQLLALKPYHIDTLVSIVKAKRDLVVQTLPRFATLLPSSLTPSATYFLGSAPTRLNNVSAQKDPAAGMWALCPEGYREVHIYDWSIYSARERETAVKHATAAFDFLKLAPDAPERSKLIPPTKSTNHYSRTFPSSGSAPANHGSPTDSEPGTGLPNHSGSSLSHSSNVPTSRTITHPATPPSSTTLGVSQLQPAGRKRKVSTTAGDGVAEPTSISKQPKVTPKSNIRRTTSGSDKPSLGSTAYPKSTVTPTQPNHSARVSTSAGRSHPIDQRLKHSASADSSTAIQHSQQSSLSIGRPYSDRKSGGPSQPKTGREFPTHPTPATQRAHSAEQPTRSLFGGPVISNHAPSGATNLDYKSSHKASTQDPSISRSHRVSAEGNGPIISSRRKPVSRAAALTQGDSPAQTNGGPLLPSYSPSDGPEAPPYHYASTDTLTSLSSSSSPGTPRHLDSNDLNHHGPVLSPPIPKEDPFYRSPQRDSTTISRVTSKAELHSLCHTFQKRYAEYQKLYQQLNERRPAFEKLSAELRNSVATSREEELRNEIHQLFIQQDGKQVANWAEQYNQLHKELQNMKREIWRAYEEEPWAGRLTHVDNLQSQRGSNVALKMRDRNFGKRDPPPHNRGGKSGQTSAEATVVR
ncbi:hypothetical protein IWQ62_001793 [Dispira parvispora]|uniref:Uncharacterized protein n=1 Tax=Dispira parvispora TaxID=1520584 RepID=A0A9W8E3F3_9FUNG|nr:hypothetical protein IWQ62_001793 [Dispira parvispora]